MGKGQQHRGIRASGVKIEKKNSAVEEDKSQPPSKEEKPMANS
jgi:hypothetical protein